MTVTSNEITILCPALGMNYFFMKDLDEVDDKMVEEEQEEEWRGRAESYELDSFVCVTGYLSGIDILLFNLSSLTSNISSSITN